MAPGQTTWTGATSTAWSDPANWSAGVPSASVDATIPAGTPFLPSVAATAAAVRTLTVDTGASVDVGGGLTLDVYGNLTVNGALAGAGVVAFAGTATRQFAGAGSVRELRIALGGGSVQINSDVTVTGDLTLSSGDLQPRYGHTLAVGGNADFLGGTLSVYSGGTIDVAGHVTFAGTTASGPQPTLRCAGNWSQAGSYQPTNGQVVFDGTGGQAVQGSPLRLDRVEVASGSAVTLGSPLQVLDTLTVSGSLDASAQALDVNGALTSTGGLDLGGLTHTFGSNVSISGSLVMSGVMLLDQANTMSLASSSPIAEVRVEKGTGSVFIGSEVAVSGDLTLVSGDLQPRYGHTLTVGGNADFLGGTLSVYYGGTIEVAGHVTFAGTAASGPQPTLRCAGNWSQAGSYQPTNGQVVFDGTAGQTVQGSPLRLDRVEVASGSAVTLGSPLQVLDTLTVSGSLDASAQALDVNGALTSTGGLDLGGLTHTFGSNVSISGSLVMSGVMVLDQANTMSLASSSPIAEVRVEKGTGGVFIGSEVAVSGDLTLVSGDLQPRYGHVLAVGGNADFLGGTLSTYAGGEIDVGGHVTFAGTTASGAQPTLRCGGNWTADGSYQPTNGQVVFDGTAAQSVGGSGPWFDEVTVASGASVTFATNPTIGGSLTVDGTLTTASGDLSVAGSLVAGGTLNGGSTLVDVEGNLQLSGTATLANGTHHVGASLDLSGAVATTGHFVCDTTQRGDFGGTIPSVEIQKDSGAMWVGGEVTVTGDVTLVSGDLQTRYGHTLTVGGNADLLGGSLSTYAGGEIDVAGNVTFAGTTASGAQPVLRCGGDWLTDTNYVVANRVELTGDGAVSQSTAGQPVQFTDLRLLGGRRSLGSTDVTIQTTHLLIDTPAVLDVGTNHLDLQVDDDSVPIAGGLEIGVGGRITFEPTAVVAIAATGGLTALGEAGSPATITCSGSGGYTLSLAGAIAAQNAVFEKMSAAGVQIAESATLAPAPNDLRAVTFGEPFPVAGAVLLDIRRTTPTEIRFPRFENPAATPGVFNVTTSPTSQPITFVNFAGDLSGETFENDPGDLLVWADPQATDLLSFTGTPGVEQITLDWATADEPDVDAFVLRRAPDPAGPFTTVATRDATGPGAYQVVDQNLDPTTTYTYELSERIDVIGATNVLSTIQITPLSASVQLAFGTPPASTATAGDTWPAFTVRIENGSGVLNTNAAETVTIQPIGGSTIYGTLSQPAVGGIATFADLSATVAGAWTFDVVAGGLTPIQGVSVTIDPAPATALVFGTAPAATVAAGDSWPAFVVRAEDDYGNLDTAFTDDVDVAVSSGGGTLAGTTTRAAVAGLATFDDLSYGLAEPIEIACSAASIPTPLTANVTVQSGAAQILVFGTPPAPAQTAGDVFGAFTIEVRDGLGNPVSVNGQNVVLTLATGSDTLQGTSTRPLVDGVATFDDIVYTHAETIRLAANVTGFTPVTSPAITVAPADPTALAFVSEPPSLGVEDAVLPAIAVQVEDTYGNVATQATDAVVVQIPALVGNAFGTLSRSPVNGVATFDDIGVDTAQTVELMWTSSGLPTISRTIVFAPFASDLRVASGSLLASPAAPAVGQPTVLQVGVVNGGQINASAVARFYVGNPDLGGTLIGQTGSTIGVGGNETFQVSWTPTEATPTDIHVVVENLTPPDDTPANNRAATLVYVGAAQVDLKVSGGRRTSWPGDEASVSVTIRNVGASSVTLSSITADSSWLTFVAPPTGVVVPPGGSVIARGDLAVPLGTAGAPLGTDPIVQPIGIAVGTSGGDTFQGALRVDLFDQPTSSLTVHVVDSTNGAAIGGALLAFQDLSGVFSTDSAGDVTVHLPAGSRGLAAFKQGYVAASRNVVVPDGTSTVQFDLEPGQTLAVQSVEERELTSQEIIQRGVDVNDPVNNTVVDFVVSMQIGEPLVIPNVEVPRTPVPGTTIQVERTLTGGGNSGSGAETGGSAYGTLSYVATPSGVTRVETWILVPGEIFILKDFFEITAVVVNRAQTVNPTDVQLRNVSASLGTLPFGLGLPDLDGVPQSLTQALSDLNAGATAQATWVVRGDEPGGYTLQAATTADAYGFGNFLSQVIATADTDPFQVTVPLIRCEFDTPSSVVQGGVFDFGVRVTNEGSSVAKLVRVNLRSADLRNCSLAALQSQATLTATGATVDLGDLAPGDTGVATFQLVSAVTGSVVELGIQSGCGGELSPPVTVIPDPPTITTQPASQTVCETAAATLHVAAAGAGPLSYQWRKGGIDIAGAVAADLVISPATATDAGDYDVVVTNEGGSTTSQTATLTVRPLPVAAFHGDVLSGVAGLGVTFTDDSTGDVTQWSWDFGDGGTSTEQNPTHVYQTSGVYTVTLRATNACSTDQAVRANYVTVVEPPPIAAFSATPTVGTAPLTVAFTDQSTGAVNGHSWDFGDGGTSTSRNPSHQYTGAGTYTVTLSVSGPGGTDDEVKTGHVRVEPQPEIAAFAANPPEVNDGDGTMLTFTFSGGNGTIDGNPVTSGTPLPVDPPDSTTTTYHLVVTNPLGAQTTRDVQVTSYALPAITAFAASPTEVNDGDSTTLSFAFSGHTATVAGQSATSGQDIVVDPPDSTTTTYTLVVENELGTQVTQDVQVTSYALPAITAFAASPTEVNDGDSTTLSLAFSGHTATVAGQSATSGQDIVVDPPDSTTTTYTLVVENELGTQVTQDVQVTSYALPAITAFAASPTEVNDGDSTTLSFAFSGHTASVAGQSVTSAQDIVLDPPDSATTTYTLVVENELGTQVTQDVQVTLYALPVITSFVADGELVTSGTQVSLTAVFSGGDGTVDNGVGSVTSGVPVPVTPPDDLITTYRLTVRSPAGGEVSATRDVEAVPAPTIESFTASSTQVENGQTVELTALFSNGVGVIEPGAIPVASGTPVTVTPTPDSTTMYGLSVMNRAGESVIAAVTVQASASLPVITQQPISETVMTGSSTDLTVVATGPAPLIYQWYKDGDLLAGETSSTLTLSDVQQADAGDYYVVVGNSAGTVMSEHAIVMVLAACPSCDGGTVLVRQGVRADFSRNPPGLIGDQTLAPYVSFDVSGPTPDTWKMIVDVGMKRLVVGRCASISTGLVDGGGHGHHHEFFAPGLVIRSSCGVEIRRGGSLDVRSRNAAAGEIRLEVDGDVRVDGCVLDRSLGVDARSGAITIASRCGDVNIGWTGIVQTDGGSDVTILTGGDPVAGAGGEITVRGLVEAKHRGEPAPTIRLVALDDQITVDGQTLHWLGVQRRCTATSGVVVRATRNCEAAGRIEIQALGDVRLLGNTVWHWAFPNPGTVAIQGRGERSGGGVIDVRSIGGRVLAVDRAIDNVNHSNGAAINRVYARDDVVLGTTGRCNSVVDPTSEPPARMAVIDVSTVGHGQAGLNQIRSFSGGIQLLSADTVVRATAWGGAGTDGANDLTSNDGILNLGWVLPADTFGQDDIGTSSPAAPPALYATASSLGFVWR